MRHSILIERALPACCGAATPTLESGEYKWCRGGAFCMHGQYNSSGQQEIMPTSSPRAVRPDLPGQRNRT
jgi:hypothetical protein